MKTTEEKIFNIKTIRRKSWIAFSVFVICILIAVISWRWLYSQPLEEGIYKPLRKILNFNEAVFNSIFSDSHLAKSYPKSAAVARVRINGDAGMNEDFDTASWKLKVVRKPGDTLFFTLDDIKKLPKTELIFNFKCIEGWSQINYWGGVKFSDFVKYYNLSEQSVMGYAGLITPNKEYYVGIDSRSMLHPQTILCYEMNGKALPLNQGYPLRLIIPVKYGIKHLKRIGTIFFSNDRPKDYWYERGYDYYSGL